MTEFIHGMHRCEFRVVNRCCFSASTATSTCQRCPLLGDELADAALCELEHGLQIPHAKGMALGRALHLEEGAGLVHHHVHVGLGIRVLGVVEVQHRYTLVNADRHGGDLTIYGILGDEPLLLHVTYRIDQGYITAGDGALTERRCIHHRTQRTADEPLYLHGAPTLPALRGLALRALTRRARQHAVFNNDPATAVAFDPARHAVFDARGAQHARVAEFDEHRAFCMFGVVAGEFDDAKFAGLSAAGSHEGSSSVLRKERHYSLLPRRAANRAFFKCRGTGYYDGHVSLPR